MLLVESIQQQTVLPMLLHMREHAVSSMGEYRGQVTGWIPEGLRLPSAVAEASAGPQGLFAGANASLICAEANFRTAVHEDLIVNTGAGVRNGNVEAHLLELGSFLIN